MSHSSSCPDAGIGSRGTESELPDRLSAAAEQMNEEPLGLQARDKMLKDTGATCHSQNLLLKILITMRQIVILSINSSNIYLKTHGTNQKMLAR